MPTNRKRIARNHKRLDPDLEAYFAILGGAQMLVRKHGRAWLREQWARHGRQFLDSWPHDRPPLAFFHYGEPEGVDHA